MRLKLHKTRLFSTLLVASTLTVTGCINDDYDSNEIDMTMGFGTDGLVLPVSSTAEIPLADVLDIDDDACVVIDSLNKLGGTAWDYWFLQSGDNVTPTHPEVDIIELDERNIQKNAEFGLSETSAAKARGVRRASQAMSTKVDIHIFDYAGERPKEVIELKEVVVSSHLKLVVDPTALRSNTSKFEKMSLQLPEYMTIDNVQAKGTFTTSGNSIVFTDVPTNAALTVNVDVVKFDFSKSNPKYGTLTINDDSIIAKGELHVEIAASNVTVTSDIAKKTIKSTIDMDKFVIESGTGRFNPSIELDDLGSVKVDNIPDFLTDDEVKVDLNNPQILLTINSDLEVPGFIDATLVSKKDGRTLATIPVDGLKVKGYGETKICVCRTETGVDKSRYDQVKVVPQLSEAIKTIPDEIYFTATATADPSQLSTIVLGHKYTITPKYDFQSPIAFAEDAQIVYTDTLDDWNSDIEDLEITDESDLGVVLTGNVENGVPAFLGVTVTPIDVNGRPLANEVKATVKINGKEGGMANASADGKTKATSTLEIELSQTRNGGINKLDGLVFRAVGAAKGDNGSACTGITLNAKNHTLRVNDIKVTIKGKYIGDFN